MSQDRYTRFAAMLKDVVEGATAAATSRPWASASVLSTLTLRQNAAVTLEVVFLVGTGWWPTPAVPDELRTAWLSKARLTLESIVSSAWEVPERRHQVAKAALLRERWLVPPGPEYSVRTHELNMAAALLLDIPREWPELDPPARSIPAVQQLVAAPVWSSPRSPSMDFVHAVNAGWAAQRSAHDAALAAEVAAADAQRNWINDTHWRSRGY